MPQNFIKFYGNDWRSDPRLRMCCAASRGIWIDLITFMMEAEPFGHLLINGRQPTPDQIGMLTCTPPSQVRKALAELESVGVFSRLEDGTIYSRRMLRDAIKAEEGRNWVNKRRDRQPSVTPPSPPSRGSTASPSSAPTSIPSSTPTSRARVPEARSQKPEASSSEPTGSGGEPPTDEQAFEKWFWQTGKAALAKVSIPAGKAGALLGRWKAAGRDQVLQAISRALDRDCDANALVAYVEASLDGKRLNGKVKPIERKPIAPRAGTPEFDAMYRDAGG